MRMTDKLAEKAEEAAKNGDLQWFIDNSSLDFSAEIKYILCSAAKNEHLNIMDWIISKTHQTVELDFALAYATRYAAESGYLIALQWLVEESGQNIVVAATDNCILQFAALEGQLEVIKWLVKECTQDVDVTAHNNNVTCWAAQEGHLDVVKWIVNESWKYGQFLVPISIVEEAMSELNTTSAEECQNYQRLQLILQFDYTLAEAIDILAKSEAKTTAQTTYTRKF